MMLLCKYDKLHYHLSVQLSPVTQSYLTLCDPMNCSMPGLPVHHQLPEFTQTHVHRVDDAIQPSHLLSSPFLPALSLSQHQNLLQWVNSFSYEVAKVLEFQLQHQSFQWTPRTDFRMDWLDLLAVQGTLKSILQQFIWVYNFSQHTTFTLIQSILFQAHFLISHRFLHFMNFWLFLRF